MQLFLSLTCSFSSLTHPLLSPSPPLLRKPESKDGARLLCLADFHLGSDINVLASHAVFQPDTVKEGPPAGPGPVAPGFRGVPPPPLPPQQQMHMRPRRTALDFGSRHSKAITSRICALSGSVDGAVGLFLPVDEKVYRRLALLQQLMSASVLTCCYLNPQQHRLLHTFRVRNDRKKGVLDGTLLWQFVNLPVALQDDLAAAMGVTADLLHENLQELDLLTSFF